MSNAKRKSAVDNFLADSSKLLDEIRDAGSFIDDLPAESIEEFSVQKFKNPLESVPAVEIQTPGYVEITISDNEMQAIADFFPATEGMEPLKMTDVAKILRDRRITEGIDWDIISESVFKCNTEDQPVTRITIARGTKPIFEIPEHLEIEKELVIKEKIQAPEKNAIDFKEQSPFKLVKKGTVLAHLVPQRVGVDGFTVTGRTLSYKKVKLVNFQPGKNTQEEGSIVVSSCDGRFGYDKRKFWVNEVLEISHDVDYKTGHIDFPGDVIIRGEIHDGFKVRAGGSIYCSRTMDASEVVSGKDVIVQRGIIGRQKGILKVEGNVQAKFIENSYIQAKGKISAEVGILNASVHTLDRITLGFKGIITGGKLYAQNGIITTQLGSQSGTKTEVYCGIDYLVEQKLQWIQDKNIEITLKLNQVKKEIGRAHSKNQELIELRDKLQAALHKMNETASTLIYYLDKNEDVEIVVRGVVFPGVYIEICHVSYIVQRKMSSVRFTLDKARGRIVPQAFTRAS